MRFARPLCPLFAGRICRGRALFEERRASHALSRPSTSLPHDRKTWMPGTKPGMTNDETPRDAAHRLPSTWVQIAIIPTNKDSEASAAAS